jgi:hypothetical protein
MRGSPLLVLALVAFALAAAPASAKTTWLCHPDLAADPCRPALDTTVFSPWDQQRGVVHPRRARKPAVDCFYVYPTVSGQPATLANRDIDPELRSIALYQVARYSQYCRVFAPVYRQLTLAGIGGTATAKDTRTAYGDVRAAWREYLARENHGRGVVLIGHSQGTGHLTQLVRAQIDRRPAVRRRLVSAILLGGNVTVRRGSDAGGSFRNVRACRSRTQLGCVVAFSTFGETPPADARFGRNAGRFARFFGQPTGPRYRVLCTNPAALGGGSARLDGILPSAPFAQGTLIAAGIALLGLPLPQASTTFVETRGAFTGRCSRAPGASFLRVAPRAGTPHPKPSPDATWGLHLVDANIALGNLVELVATQIARYQARRG